MSEFEQDLMSEFEKNVACVMDSVFGSLRKTELDYIDKVIKERDLYKEVIEEAREYVNNHIHQETFTGYMDSYELKKLLQILGKAGDIDEKKN